MAELHVEIVAVERELWSGEATFVFTRTTAGEIGILPRHIPLVAQLVDDAMVRVEREGEDDLRIAVDGGFLSVTEEAVRSWWRTPSSSRRSTPTRPSRTPSPTTSAPRPGAGRGCAPSGQTRLRPPMSASMVFMVALVGVLLLVVVALGYRLWKLRRWAAPPRSCATSPPSAATAGATA